MSRARAVRLRLLTAAAIAVVICAVAWPADTLTLGAGTACAAAGAWALAYGVRGLIRGGKTRTRLEEQQVTAPADTTAQPAGGERCCVCGGPETPYENYRGQLFCWPCANCPCGQVPCVRTGINDQAVSAEAGARLAQRQPAGKCAGCIGCGGPDCLQRPADDDLTAQEARDLADDLSLQLYRAQDALAFVAEMCDLADEQRGVRGQPATVTTARVREWLRGAQCARQAGLVVSNPDTPRKHPDEAGQDTADQAGHDPDALRNRVAAAIWERENPGRKYADCERPWNADAEEDAEAVLAELAPELSDLAALHEGEEPYTDEATVPAPAQWIWLWNHSTPAQRLDHAARALANAQRLQDIQRVLVTTAGRDDLTVNDVLLRVRDALDAPSDRPPQ